MISFYVSSTHQDWDDVLPYIVFAYNTSQQQTTKESPFKLLYGREPVLPVDIALGLPEPKFDTSEWLMNLNDARDLIRFRVELAQEQQQKQFNQRRRDIKFKKGDKILVYFPKRERSKYTKFFHMNHGPFEVIRHTSNVNVLVKDLRHPRRKPQIVHVERCMVWRHDDETSSVSSADRQTLDQAEDDQVDDRDDSNQIEDYDADQSGDQEAAD
jgi:hypothetical protein